jgi:nickel/cobalt exporter
VHALTPEHGKLVLASYLLGSRLAAARAAGAALLLAADHVGAAVVLAELAAPLVTRTLSGVGRAPTVETVSRVMLFCIGI